MPIIERFFSLKFMMGTVPEILSRLPLTLWIALSSTLIGWVIGFFTAVIRMRRIKVLAPISDFYISFIRGTPLMVQIYLTYYGIPIVIACVNALRGHPEAVVNSFRPTTFAIIAFAINCGAYSSETIRAAIQSIDRGQIEAAYSVGLTGIQTMKRIVLPQALIVAVPTLSNSLMSNIQGTSLAFCVSVVDIMAAAKLAGARGYRYFEVFVVVAIIYWISCMVVQRFMKRLEKKLQIPGQIEIQSAGA
ncbi:amino acid ABC transporter permease [Treponema primitia]|uniref:amino acid ABC transporter permease n=1 Tax=Treponema primitia TaxID=88058 RepID=UPI00025552C2|nr:amino acid ABC transporter permease [Treponema primitia]